MMVKAWTNRAAHNMVARKQRERERHTERQRDRERGNERRDCAIGLPLVLSLSPGPPAYMVVVGLPNLVNPLQSLLPRS